MVDGSRFVRSGAGLVKNAFGLIFAVLILIIEGIFWIVERRRPGAFRAALGLVAIVAISVVAYASLMAWATDGLFIRNLYQDIFVRATRGVDPGHLHGPGFYFKSVYSDFGLWLLFVVPALAGILRRRRSIDSQIAAWLLLWSLGILVGFSLSVSKLPWYVYSAYPALALVIASGLAEAFSVLATGRRKAVGIVAVFAAFVFHLGGTWEAVKSDVRVLDSHKFVREYSKLANATLIVDEASLREHGRFREWNRFYFGGAPGVRWKSDKRLRIQLPPEGCLFLATGDPMSHQPTGAYPWRVNMTVRKVDRLAARIWILGTCDLDVPGTNGAEETVFAHIIRLEDFEAGDSSLASLELSDEGRSD